MVLGTAHCPLSSVTRECLCWVALRDGASGKDSDSGRSSEASRRGSQSQGHFWWQVPPEGVAQESVSGEAGSAAMAHQATSVR